jgi:hypothetical protein
MATARVPRQETALKRVAPIVPEIYRAFEHGTMKSSQYFSVENLQRDPYLEAMLVKAHAREHLHKAPDFSKVVFDKLAMCGIAFRYGKWQFRLWKSADPRQPKVPQPGHSAKRRLYFVQPEQLVLFDHKKKVTPKLHLIILWNLDTRGDLEKLWLVCPESFDPESGAIRVYWVAELPNPVTGLQASPALSPTTPLPFTPREIEKRKGE